MMPVSFAYNQGLAVLVGHGFSEQSQLPEAEVRLQREVVGTVSKMFHLREGGEMG